jgi:hypothetical protein
VSGSPHRRRLLGILSGSWVAQGCYALAKLGVPDLLAGGPRPADELARATGADPEALHRLLRAMARCGLLRSDTPGVFALTATSELLRSDVPDSVYLHALMQGEEVFASFAEIMYTLRTGRPAFEKVYGRPFYAYLDEHPDAAAVFTTSMGAQPVPPVLDEVDWSTVDGAVVDLGGGDGGLLAEILAGRSGLRGVLFERPGALAGARERMAGAGLAGRVEFVEGDFFASVPAHGGAYLLARVLHNWDDGRAAALLDRVRAAMPAHARLLVVEEFLAERVPPGTGGGGMVDLLMLVTMTGHDRTEAQYRRLLAGAGFEVLAARPGTGSPAVGLLEARPA